MSSGRPAELAADEAVDLKGATSRPDVTRASWIALSILLLVYLLNNLDRFILSILAQPIKEELRLADWQLGLLTGFAFSLLYVVVGFPMARLSDRGNRTLILSLCVAFWSIMTALCGLATSFVQLCLFRAGVGVGEAACLPASHSLISDLFPPEARTRAMSIFGLGLPLGGFAGVVIGGFVMDHWGWRSAMLIVGLPGLLVALLTWMVIKEPERGRFERASARTLPSAGSLIEVAMTLWKSPIARNVIIALTAAGLVGAPNVTFMGPYMIRRFDLGYTELGVIIALTFMLGSAISTLGGGLIVHWASRFDDRWIMWVPAIGVALSAPLYVAAYAQSSWQGLAAILFLASVVNSTYLAPSYAMLHSTVGPNGRATASVIASFCLSLIAMGFGPLLAGMGIDLLAAHLFGAVGQGGFSSACPGGAAAAGSAPELASACRSATSQATQWVIMGCLAAMVWPAWHFFLAARHMTIRTTSNAHHSRV
ncbi:MULTISPECIES: spinster family MFS transporter [unclassified Sphingobium]|uniref:spinster family MFS transporter n=1 Tax=unclassified Sphingobium TaxID=2611147 RepID=UPI0022250B95|nr:MULTISPECIES: MFS transporter [unclassified Sphingobium]MCW2395785.1 putative MFS family arabinose efflux permease [Sphingobium sp. B8D3B]MCW2419300.1 putative MFS family arabinose efflux permease [Sphingobium sp. B8D3C]